jgi:hypothetical protein
VPAGARVLDVGCGEGELMAVLRDEQQVDARGMEIDPEAVEKCVARGLSAIQGDANRDLADYPDRRVRLRHPEPDAADRRAARPDARRAAADRPQGVRQLPQLRPLADARSLLWNGRMPVTRHLPVSWYETQNIHHVTVTDFPPAAARQGRGDRAQLVLQRREGARRGRGQLARGVRGVPAQPIGEGRRDGRG